MEETGVDDRVTLEVYQGWLQALNTGAPVTSLTHPASQERSSVPSNEEKEERRDLFSSNRGVGVIGSGDNSVFRIDAQAHDHQHDHDHHHHANDRDENHSAIIVPPHDHGHIHESRVTVECRAINLEEPESPGQRVGQCLIRLLKAKEIVSAADIRVTVSKLESFTDNLLGADLVVKAWMDEAFKSRLLSDGMCTVIIKVLCLHHI
jgi:hypothetical protein